MTRSGSQEKDLSMLHNAREKDAFPLRSQGCGSAPASRRTAPGRRRNIRASTFFDVEQGFRFLKQPIYLGPVLLKKRSAWKCWATYFFSCRFSRSILNTWYGRRWRRKTTLCGSEERNSPVLRRRRSCTISEPCRCWRAEGNGSCRIRRRQRDLHHGRARFFLGAARARRLRRPLHGAFPQLRGAFRCNAPTRRSFR